MSAVAIEALIILAAKYGPELVLGLTALFKKKDATIEDIETLFASVKPWSGYGIPDNPPTTGGA